MPEFHSITTTYGAPVADILTMPVGTPKDANPGLLAR